MVIETVQELLIVEARMLLSSSSYIHLDQLIINWSAGHTLLNNCCFVICMEFEEKTKSILNLQQIVNY